MRSHISSAKNQLKYSKTPCSPDKKQWRGERQQSKKTKHNFFTNKRKSFSKNHLKRQTSKIHFLIIYGF